MGKEPEKESDKEYENRAATGIPGLDELIEGGFPRGRTVLLSGACGTGKTIFCMQYLVKGALEHGEPGIFVTYDESPKKLREDVRRFGWDVDALEKENKLAIIDATSAKAGRLTEEKYALASGKTDPDNMFTEVNSVMHDISAKRIVIDSLPAMSLHVDKPGEARNSILRLSYSISGSGLTAILTTETDERPLGSENSRFSHYGVEEYVADGVIVMSFLKVQKGVDRTLYVRKMRNTKHSGEINPLEIGKDGIVVRKIADVFK